MARLIDSVIRRMRGGAEFGGNSNYLTISNAGVVAMAGTARPDRKIFVPPSAFYVTGASVSATSLNSMWSALQFTPSASSSDVTIYAQVPVPPDMDVSYGITPSVLASRGTSGSIAAVMDWEVDIDTVASGEASSAASTSHVTNGASYTAATSNSIARMALSNVGAAVIAANDVLSLELRLEGSDGKTTAGCPYFLGLELAYKASAL